MHEVTCDACGGPADQGDVLAFGATFILCHAGCDVVEVPFDTYDDDED